MTKEHIDLMFTIIYIVLGLCVIGMIISFIAMAKHFSKVQKQTDSIADRIAAADTPEKWIIVKLEAEEHIKHMYKEEVHQQTLYNSLQGRLLQRAEELLKKKQ